MTERPDHPDSKPDRFAPPYGFDLRETLGFAWREWKFIAAVAAAVLLVGVTALLQQTPLYTATSTVLLQHEQSAPGPDIVPGNTDLDIAMIESQIAIIRSTVLLRRVVEREHLVAGPASDRHPRQASSSGLAVSFSSVFAGLVSVVRHSAAEQPRPRAAAAPVRIGPLSIPPAEMRAILALRRTLTVSHRRRQGYALAISVTAPDPLRAARLANAVAGAYLVDKLDTRFEEVTRASAWLSGRLAQLRAQLHDSEEAVERFRAEHGLVDSGAVTLTQQQLSEFNAKLVDARADLAQQSARRDLLRAIEKKGGTPLSMPDFGGGSALAGLRQQQAALSAQEAKLLARYAPSHPFVVNVRAQLADVRRAIAAETQHLAARVTNRYELARTRVAALEAALRAATGQTNLDQTSAIRLRELERTQAVNKTLFEDFLKRSKIAEAQRTFEPQEVRVLTPALPPATPSAPSTSRYIALSLVLGLGLGIGGAVAKERLNSGFMTAEQVEDTLALPVLASVGHLAPRERRAEDVDQPIHALPRLKPLSRFGESIRSLRTGIRMTDVDNPPQVIQLTSAIPGEGKTTIGMSLAASAALAGLKVLFIDADLRHPTASAMLGRQAAPGLVDILLGEVRAEDAVRPCPAGGCWGLGAGKRTQNPSDLLGSERMKRLVDGFRQAYDLVVIDTPPVGPVADPLVVAPLSDKIVVIVHWRSTARDLVQQSIAKFPDREKVAGIVFNQIDPREARKYGRGADLYCYGGRNYTGYYAD